MDEVLKELQELKNLTLLGTKRALNMDDAVLFTGLSRSHLYKLCCYHKIEHWKSNGGKHTYFDKSELTAWMLHRRIKTDDELAAEAANHCISSRPKRK